MESIINPKNGYRIRSILGISFFAHMLVHTYMVIFPVLMPFIIEEFAVDYLVVGAIFTISNLAFGFGGIGAGVLADRVGSKSLIVICALGMGGSSLLASMTSELTGFTISMLLLGLFASLYHPASFSLISKATRSRGKAFGIHGVGGSLGLALAPVIGIPVAMGWGWRSAFLLLAIPGILLGLATILVKLRSFVGDERRIEWRFRGLFTKGFVLTLAIYACYGLCFQGVVGFLPSFLTETGGLILGGLFASTITLAMGAGGQLAGGFLTDRQGASRFLMTSFLLLGFSLCVMALVPGQIALLVALATGFLIFSSQPGTGTLLAEQSSDEIRGVAYGLAFMANFGVGAMGTALAGFIADTMGGLVFVFPSMAIFMGIAILLTVLLKRESGNVGPNLDV